MYQLCTQCRSDFGPFFLADLFQVVQVGWTTLVDRNFQIVPQILNGIEIRTLTGPL
ncbi:UNVERIFIED_CONTAM: hypothetical protein FKN15_034438 [Acipenser sinensis]